MVIKKPRKETKLSKKLKKSGLSRTKNPIKTRKSTVSARKTAKVYRRPRKNKLRVHYGG
jgi:hypothetical protein